MESVGSVEIPLSRGLSAIIDKEDFERVSKYKWCAVKSTKDGEYYASAAASKFKKKIKGFRTIRLHRFIMGLDVGDPFEVDHKNLNKLDNRKCNLRLCSKSQNGSNRVDIQSSSGFKGVKINKKLNKWEAWIKYTDSSGVKHNKYIKLFSDPKDAAKAYDEAALKYHGEFARTNKMMGLL